MDRDMSEGIQRKLEIAVALCNPCHLSLIQEPV